MTALDIDVPRAFGDLFRPARFKVFYGGRGGAKSWAFAVALLSIGMTRPIRVLCARELQTSIKDSVHKLLSDLIAAEPAMAAFYEVQQTVIKGRNGTEFGFRGLKHNASEIKSFEGADYVWVEEAQAVSDNSWEILIPTIRKPGSEIWLCFNPKNPTDPTWRKFVAKPRPGSVVKKVSWRDNPFFPDVLEAERVYCRDNEPDSYDHVWEGGFDTRYSGAVYAKWVQAAMDAGRIGSVYDPELPVHTAWDLGYDDSTAIVFWQRSGTECRIIDAYEANGQDVEHYCELLRSKSYRYGEHYVPHDAANKLLAAGGRSIVQQMHALGIKARVVAATSQQNQIEATRKVMQSTWWDTDKCADLIHALMSYHFEYDEDRKAFKSTPLHDWSSHFADAVEIIGQVWQKETVKATPASPRFLNKMTADELFWGSQTKQNQYPRGL